MTGAQTRVVAQAKLNLRLRVLAREDSGYHSLETLFHRIDLADDLTLQVTRGERTMDVRGADVGPPETNLAFRAAALYSDVAQWPAGYRIELTKRIPVGAGLGGGSADAAAVLRALESLAPNPMGTHRLLSLASSLGADVPFLASDFTMAIAWGRGDRMLQLEPLPQCDVTLVVPEEPVSTAEAYRWLDADREVDRHARENLGRKAVLDDVRDAHRHGGEGSATPAPATATLIQVSDLASWERVARLAVNDFIPPLTRRRPEIGDLLRKLQSTRPLLASMTGSGSTLFAIYADASGESQFAETSDVSVLRTRTSVGVVQPFRIG